MNSPVERQSSRRTSCGKEIEREKNMFDTMNVAKIIKQKRMEKNLTQMQLADALGISYQAVSNWERGNSMPDISKLGELSTVLGCSVEELLGDDDKAKVVEDMIKGEEPKEMDMEDLVDVAPILPPKQTEDILGQMLKEAKDVDLSDLAGLAPFLSDEMLEQFAENVSDESCFLDELCGIAPFLSKEALDRLVKKAILNGNADIDDVAGLAPFLSKETLNDVVMMILQNDADIDDVACLAPFLSKETLDDVVTFAIESNGEIDLEDLTGLCPFLSKQTVQRIAAAMIQQGNLDALAGIAVFMR